VKTRELRIGGMTCVSCQNKIERKLLNTAGVERAAVSYSKGAAVVTYDPDMISYADITAVIRKLDYTVPAGDEHRQTDINRIIGILIIIAALYILMRQLGVLQLFGSFQLVKAGMGYGMLFVIGLITSVHCLAMCGGLNLSQCIPGGQKAKSGNRAQALRPSFLYNLGRVLSYTAVGGVVGAVGSAITFTGAMRGAVQLAAGVFMVIMGLNMIGVFPWLRKLTPRLPRVFSAKIDAQKSNSKSPLIVGLLNGLMPCGPLQAMQLYALSTGSPLSGALSMLLFSLGTVPLMFGLGALSSVLTKKFTRKVMTVGAVLVVVLGLSMFSSGWSLSGFSQPGLISENANAAQIAGDSANGAPASGNPASAESGVQTVNSTLASGKYPPITVQVGVPVKWIIDVPQGSINGCNNKMIIPEYSIEHSFEVGENIIEFTPTETGKFAYSCWMGMIRSTITVTETGAES
jgi:sulfite exporter TauE/SafE